MAPIHTRIMTTKLGNRIIKGIKYKSQYFRRIITIYLPIIILFPTHQTDVDDQSKQSLA